MKEEKSGMLGKYIPGLLALGAVLASYKLLGGPELIEGLSHKELVDEYDYIIGEYIILDFVYDQWFYVPITFATLLYFFAIVKHIVIMYCLVTRVCR